MELKPRSRLRDAWAMTCTVLLIGAGGYIWFKFFTLPTYDAPHGLVCVCPQDDGQNPSRNIPEERYY